MPPPPSFSREETTLQKLPSHKSSEVLFESPPFTIKELREAIPAYCFERSLIRSFMYLLADLSMITFLLFIAITFDAMYGHTFWSWIFWPVWWFVQGAFMVGVWVVAHECGHQSFSAHKFVNDAVGWLCHSLLFVPYHSWRITHGQHHKSTSHMQRDTVYVPITFKDVSGTQDVHTAIADSPLGNLVQILVMLIFGWPIYLAINAWGQKYDRRASHLEPSAPFFKPENRFDILFSDFGLILTFSLLCWLSYTFSVVAIIKFYGIPYLWVNFWLVLITYLQHTDKRVPHYRGDEWNFIRGALCTVDRNYGILGHIFHHIGDTHVSHHLFSTMPHYHSVEATYHLKRVLGKFYLQDNTPILKALWNNWTTCHYVEDQGDILFYQTFTQHKKAT